MNQPFGSGGTWRRVVGALAFVVAATSAWACSDDDVGAPPAAKCPIDDSECKEIATVEAGAQAIGPTKRNCVRCHGDDMSGSTKAVENISATFLGEPVELYPPNLTPDPETGTAPPEQGGRWTDDALALAIRTGVDEESQALCPQMEHFSQMSDFEVYSIVKYLRSIPAVKKKVPRSVCPPTKTKEQQKL
jgi:hypothetical protein